MGPLLAMLGQLPEHFLVMNGDVLTDLDFADVLQHPPGVGRAAHRRHLRAYGEHRLRRAHHRRGRGGGVQREAERRLPRLHGRLRRAPGTRSTGYTPGLPLGFDELVLDLLAAGNPPRAYDFDGYWLDIGRPDDYDRANAEFGLLRGSLLKGA